MAALLPDGRRKHRLERATVTGDPTPGPIKRGLGCSANRWGGAGTGARAHCEITSDGGVVMRCGTQDIGTATRTIMAMIVAETLGLEVAQVTIELGDSNFPFAPRLRRSDHRRGGLAGDAGDRRQGAGCVFEGCAGAG